MADQETHAYAPHHADYRLIGGAGERVADRLGGRRGADTVIWYAAIVASGVLAGFLWHAHSWWAVPAFLIYGTLYCSPADSRWHEAGHGTAFKTRWMNDVLYQIASFQVFRCATICVSNC